MLKIGFAPKFFRMLKKLEPALQEEVFEKIELFKDPSNHAVLKMHKLHGPLSSRYSFSVNYKIRIVFIYKNPKKAVLLAVGGHNIYK